MFQRLVIIGTNFNQYNMRKFTLFFIILGLLAVNILNTSAQRPEEVQLNVTFKQLPLKPLPADLHTYKSTIHPNELSFKYIHLNKPLAYVETGNSNNYGSVEQCEQDFLGLPGYERVSESPDLFIDVYFSPFNIKSKTAGDAPATFIENKQKVIRTVYYYDVEYTYEARINIVTATGDTIFSAVNEDPNIIRQVRVGSSGQVESPYPSFGASYTSLQELEVAYQSKFIAGQEADKTRDWLSKYMNYIYYNYARPVRTIAFVVASAKGNKYNYDNLDSALKLVEEGFKLISEQAEQEVVNNKLMKAIEIWNKELESADFSKKNSRINERVAGMLHYNIGLAYGWMQEFEKCSEHLLKAQEYRKSAKEAAVVKSFMDDYKKRLEANI